MLVSDETMLRDPGDRALPRPERYEILRKIGAGSQAEVLLGTARGERGFRRRVAIKRVPSDLENAARLVADLIQEAQLIARLSHPNVVSALDVDHDNAGRPFLVMEYIDGITLGKLVESGPVPHPIASFIVRELLSGLGYIHESRDRARGRGRGRRGLVHRDVSPDNVLLSWEGEVKLADFGVAQVLESTMTAPAIVAVGKPGYMSPEQVNRQALDGRSDLYAVGIVLWELLARRRLFVGSVDGIPTSAMLRDIPRPSEFRQGVPADLEAVAMRLVAHDRGGRYQTAGLAAHDLMRCHAIPRDGRAELARLLDERFPRAGRHHPNSQPPSLGTPSDAARTVTAPSVPMDAPPWPWMQADVQRRDDMLRRRRRRALAWGVMLALLVAAAVALHIRLPGYITTEGTGSNMLCATTKTDTNAVEWSISDEVIRLRQWGTDRIHVLAPQPSEGWLMGTAESCSLRLVDQLVSHKHARVIREQEKWLVHDLGSKNGLKYDGARRDTFILEPGIEIEIGDTTLIAESRQSITLHGFLARILGWKKERANAVDHALRTLRLAMSRRAALILIGKSDLVTIAQGLHRHTLGDDRPFIACDPRRQNTDESVRSAANYVSGLAGFVAATGGSLCVRSSRLPRDFEEVLVRLREADARVQLVVCMQDADDCGVCGTVPIEVPPLADRTDELPRIIDEYARDAIATLGAPQASFTSADRDWALKYAARSLTEIEKATLRLVALRIARSLPQAAERLGMAPVSLSRWLGRRKLPVHLNT